MDVREVFHDLIGQKLADVTCNDPDDDEQFVLLMFEGGGLIKITYEGSFRLGELEDYDA